MRQARLLSVGTDGGGYINLLCTNKDGFSLDDSFTDTRKLCLDALRRYLSLDAGVYCLSVPMVGAT